MKKLITLFLFIFFGLLSTNLIAENSNTPNASFSYIFSWTSSYQILLINSSQGYYDQISWDMGDGTIYNSDQTEHTYQNDGDYTITLTVSDSETGDSSSFSLFAYIPSTGCNNTFSYQATGETAEFSFQGIFPYAPSPAYLAFEWDFGDGTSSSGGNVIHTFPDTGVDYLVTLTTVSWAPGNDTCYFSSSQTVNSGTTGDCFASFDYEPISEDGMTIQFTNTSFISGGGSPTSVSWDFGDFQTSDELNPQHTYYDNGTYQVILEIYDSVSGCFDQTVMEIVVDGNPPLRANFYYKFINFYEIIIVDRTTGNITDYEWNMGDGNIINGPLTEYKYEEDGLFTITLLVTDSTTGEQLSHSLPISMPNTGCNAYYTYESTGNEHEFTFDALYVYFVLPWFDGYSWDFGDGNTAEGGNVTHTFDASQGDSFIVTMNYWSTDLEGQDTCFFSYSDTIFIELEAMAAAASDPDNPLMMHFTDISEGDPTAWFWDFGDGNTSMMKNPTHVFATAGTYDVCLTAYRGNMPEDTNCQPMTVGTVGLGETFTNAEVGAIYPNPNAGHFKLNVQSVDPRIMDVIVYNSIGQVVYKNRYIVSGNQLLNINLDEIPPGIFHVSLNMDGERVVKNILVR